MIIEAKLKIVLSMITVLVICASITAPAFAYTEKDICKTRFNTEDINVCVSRMRAAGIYFVDPLGAEVSKCNISQPDSSDAPNSKSLYMIGDSITEGSTAELSAAFDAAGFENTINGVSSRSLSTGNKPTNGLSELEKDGPLFAQTNVIVVALGTNGGLSQDNIQSTIDILKANNSDPDTKIFWVNIASNNDKRDEEDIPYQSWNTILKDSSQVYTIVDWASTVESNPDVINDDGYGVHPNEEGKKLFATTIVAAIKGGGSENSACTPQKLDGSDNPEKVWNFMIAKGLEPFQVAAFMGNMQAEAGFEPRRLEYAYSEPPHLSDSVPPCGNEKCQPGWGIVQWTAISRKDGLRAFIEGQGGVVDGADNNDVLLQLQLEYVWKEIEGACCSLKSSFVERYGNVTVLEALKQTTTTEEATDLILRNYEIPADMDAAYLVRIVFAYAWLVKFGGGA